MKAWKWFRYSAVGVFLAGMFSALQGCTETENIQAIILLLLLLLLGGGGANEGANNGEAANTFTLNLANGAAAFSGVTGNVIDTNGLINCNFDGGAPTGDCAETADDGTVFALTATPVSNFSNWENCDVPVANACGITLDADKTVGVQYLSNFTLNIVNGAANFSGADGTVTDGGGLINCFLEGDPTPPAGDCTEIAIDGTMFTLTATPSSFQNWENCDLPAGNVCTVTLDANEDVGVQYLE